MEFLFCWIIIYICVENLYAMHGQDRLEGTSHIIWVNLFHFFVLDFKLYPFNYVSSNYNGGIGSHCASLTPNLFLLIFLVFRSDWLFVDLLLCIIKCYLHWFISNRLLWKIQSLANQYWIMQYTSILWSSKSASLDNNSSPDIESTPVCIQSSPIRRGDFYSL